MESKDRLFCYRMDCLLFLEFGYPVGVHHTEWIYFSKPFAMIPFHDLARPTVGVASYFYALGLLFMAGWIVSYGLTTFHVGNTLLYLIVRQKRDGENLLERVDREEEDEEEAVDAEKSDENSD